MMAFLALLTVLVIVGSVCFAGWLEDSESTFWAASPARRILAVLFEQPAILTVIVVAIVSVPFAVGIEYLSKGKLTGDAMEAYFDFGFAVMEYYGRFVPGFITKGSYEGHL